MIVPQYGSSKFTVFVWGKNTILKFVGYPWFNSSYNHPVAVSLKFILS